MRTRSAGVGGPQHVHLSGLNVAYIDTDLARGFDRPKLNARDVGSRVDCIEADEYEIVSTYFTRQLHGGCLGGVRRPLPDLPDRRCTHLTRRSRSLRPGRARRPDGRRAAAPAFRWSSSELSVAQACPAHSLSHAGLNCGSSLEQLIERRVSIRGGSARLAAVHGRRSWLPVEHADRRIGPPRPSFASFLNGPWSTSP